MLSGFLNFALTWSNKTATFYYPQFTIVKLCSFLPIPSIPRICLAMQIHHPCLTLVDIRFPPQSWALSLSGCWNRNSSEMYSQSLKETLGSPKKIWAFTNGTTTFHLLSWIMTSIDDLHPITDHEGSITSLYTGLPHIGLIEQPPPCIHINRVN